MLVTIIIFSGLAFTPIITGDLILLKNVVLNENQMITFYQNNSPPIANFISKHFLLRNILRETEIKPIIKFINFLIA